jgi:hypothetical protein
MEKIIKALLLSLISLPVFGQTYYQDIGDEDYKNLMKNGLTYIQNGDKVLDSMLEIGLENYWKVSPYKIIDASGTIKEDDVIITLLEGTKLVIVSVKALKGKEISLYKTTAVADITGFKSMVDEDMFHLLPYLINAFSDMAEKMNANKIEKRGLPYFNKMNELYLPNSKVLKDKTLLILTGAIQGTDVNKEELTKAGIKFEYVTFDRFKEIESKESEDYCVLYLNSAMFSDITIFNVSDKSIAYTRHYIKNVPSLDKEDIKLIASSWK